MGGYAPVLHPHLNQTRGGCPNRSEVWSQVVGKRLRDRRCTYICVFLFFRGNQEYARVDIRVDICWKRGRYLRKVHVIPLSRLAHDLFKTVCDRKFSFSYVPSLPLQDASHLFYARKWSNQVASEFWTCSKFRGSTWRFKLLHWVSRTFAQRYTTLC